MRRYDTPMGIKGRVINGRIVVDEPTTLPEGTELDLVLEDGGDDLDDEERAALDDHLERAYARIHEEQGRPAEDVIAELRRNR
jgi:hypothetical protein